MNSPIRAVLFDCDGVLQRPANDWRGDVARVTGLEGSDLDAFLDDAMTAEEPVLDGSEPFAVPLAAVLARWGLSVPVEELLEVWQHIAVDRAMLDGAHALRAEGIVCALGTNQHRERAAYLRHELGYEDHFDPMIISGEVGAAKPDPAFFRHAIEQIGLPAGQILFVDDVQANVDSARTVGLVAELFTQHGGRAELDRILALHDLAEPVAA